MSRVIEIENLYKEYRLGVIGYGTLREDLQSWWAKIRGKEDPNSLLFSTNQSNEVKVRDHILALDGINLTIDQGERLGIIGKNGAGKTTLLKILAQIASPTKGSAKIRGRVASLIAVGTGFHGELTGRENVYLNGAILGLTKSEINGRFDEIVQFSGVEQFIDTPVKRYSSGMHIRLGFAVAAHLEPDVLIVDEVLAVGDYEFQKKCIGKMSDVASEGRTVLFVSHNLTSVRELCSRTILLEEGRKVLDGETSDVISYYTNNAIQGNGGEDVVSGKDGDSPLFKNRIIRLERVRSLNDSGELCNIFTVRDDIFVQFEYEILVYKKLLNIHLFLCNENNVLVLFSYMGQNDSSFEAQEKTPGEYISTCKIPGDFLNHGSFYVIVGLEDDLGIYFQEKVCFFDISDSKNPEGARGYWFIDKIGGEWPPEAIVRPKLEWHIECK